MSIHYKFKSALEYDTITFDGLHISVKDLKSSILQQKRIGKNSDFDLQVTNAQTKEVYSDDDSLIPKNTSLLIARVPLSVPNKGKSWEGYGGGDSSVSARLDDGGPIGKQADLSSLDASEDDKIRAMISQSTQEYDPSNYLKVRGANQVGPVPPNYRCYKCHLGGHWIKDCPLGLSADSVDIKKSTGIPKSFMREVAGPDVAGAMITPNGSYAVHCNTVDATAQASGAQTADGGANTGPPLGPTFTTRADIPEDLICSICDDLLVDAVMIPCCGNSFCDECVRNSLLESEEHECPDCHERDIAPTTLIPNRFLRKSVATFKNESGYVKKYREPRLILPRNVEPIPADSSVNNAAADNSGKTIISEADSTESAKLAATNDVAKIEPKEEAEKPQKPVEEQQPPTKPISTLVQQEQVPSDVRPITNVANTYRENRQHGGRERERTDNNGTRFRMTHQQPTGTYQRGDRSPRPPERPKYRRSPQRGGLVREERSDTPTIDEPGLAGLGPAPDPHRDYAPPPGTFMNSEPRPQQLQGPPMQGHPSQMMPQQQGPPHMQLPPPGMSIPPPGPYGGMPPQQQQQQLGVFVPGMPPNFRLPPPGAPPPGMPPYMPGPYSVPPRPMFDGSRGPPPMVQAPLGAGYPPNFAPRGRPVMPLRRTPPNMSIIDDPLEAFNRILREKDERRRRQQQQAQQHRRSYSRSRSSSRSYSRSPQSNRRGASRSPPPLRGRRGASRSPPMRSPRSFTISRSRSRSRSPSLFRDRDRDRDYSPPPSSYHHHPRDHHRDYRERAHGSPPPPLRSHDSGGSYGGPPPARHFRGGRRGAPRYRGALGSRSPPPSHLMTGRNASPPPPPQRGYGGRGGGFKDFKDSERGGDSRHNFESSQSHYAASQQPRDLRDSLRDLRGDRDQRQSSPQQRRSSRERSPPPNRRGGGFSPGRGAALLETPRHAAPQQDSGDSVVRRPRSRDREKEQRDRNRNRDRDRERERNRDRVAQDVTGFYPPPAAIQGAVPVVAPLPAVPVVPPGVMDFNSRFAGHYAGPLGTEQPLPPGEDPIPPPQSLPPPQIIPQPQQYQPLVQQQLIIPPIQHYDQQQAFLAQNQQPIPFMQHALPSQELAHSSRGNRDDNRKSRYERHDRNRDRTPPTNRDKSRTSSKDNYDSPDRRSKQQRSRKDLPVEHSPKGRKDKDYSDDDKKSRKAEKKKKKDKKEKDKDPDKKKKKDRKDSEKKEKKKNKEKADASDKEDRKKLIDIKFPEEFKQAQEKQEEKREKSAPIQEKDVEAANELPVAPPEIIIQPEVKRNQLDDLYGDLLGEEIVDSNIVQSYGKLHQDEVMRAVEQPQQLLSEEVEVENTDQLEDKLEESFESAKTPELKQDVSLTDDLDEASVHEDGLIVEQDLEEPKELEMDVLELHSQDEVEVDKELLHLMPEKSKWETDVIELDQTIEGYTTKHEDKEESKVSSEVLKRAENAIFAKAINAIRPPIEIKKISLDRAKLYSNSNERTTTKIEQDFQVTLKNDHYHEAPSSDDVTIVHDHAGAVDVPEQKPPPLQRLSVKERLGCKVDDLDRIIRIDLDRNRSRSMSPLSKKYMEMQSKPPHRRIEVAKKEDRTRYSSKDKDRHARSYRNAERSRSKDKKDESSTRKKTTAEKPREKSGDRKKRRSRSKSRDNKKKDTKRVRKEKEKPTKSSQREKEEPQPSKRSSEAKVDRAERSGRGGAERQRSAEPAPPGTEDSPPPTASLPPPLSTSNKKAVEKQRKATIDEASFEPDYDLESDVEEKGRAKPSKRSTTPQPIRQVVKQKVKIEQQSSSESSSEAEKKSKKKHKKKSKKRRRKESTSSSSESSSDSDDKKRKKHKKKSKKSKKRKHKDR